MRIAVLGNKTTTKQIIETLNASCYQVHTVVNVAPEHSSVDSIADYTDLKDTCSSASINLYRPIRYNMKTKEDFLFFKEQNFDIVFCVGWQRLIPKNILETIHHGAFGMHGSSEPLPRGRGRSPMNWSILEGRTSFITNLFRYSPGVDDGDIVSSMKFQINQYDDCNTLHFKNTLCMERLIFDFLSKLESQTMKFKKQSDEIEPTEYLKRTPEHGRIIWKDHSMDTLSRHVRCQTKPFPGAFSHLNGSDSKTYFWVIQPFDEFVTFPEHLPGTVVRTFPDGSFLVATWDGSVLVKDASGEGEQTVQVLVNDKFLDTPLNG